MTLDTEQAHRHFSVECFNRVWELLDQSERTAADEEQMIHLAHASLWHWTQREGCSDTNLSVGYWQLARVYALLGEAANASKYAHRCLHVTPTDQPFYLGYAFEAVARAETLAGRAEEAKTYLAKAQAQADLVSDDEEQRLLVSDLQSLES